MYETGRIINKTTTGEGLMLSIFLPRTNAEYFLDKNGDECGIWFNDNRHITVEQRKKIYAVIKDIADYIGYAPEDMKQVMKFNFIIETGKQEFSLSDCSIQEASDFLDYLIDFAMKENIPLSDLGINRTSDINKFLYNCLKHRKCCVCGKTADIHHDDTIGMGSDRRRVDDSKYRKTALCRIHHTERHTIGETAFFEKYHVYGIVYEDEDVDKNLLNIMDLDWKLAGVI